MRKYGSPIADALREFGVQVDVLDEDSIQQFYSMNDGAALHAKYDVIWLGPFENIWKVLTASPAPEAIAAAVKAGTAFIHTGGESSFHGGFDRAANTQLSVLGDILPVQISPRIDLVLPPAAQGESVTRWGTGVTRLNEIKIEDPSPQWSDSGYSALGLTGFNQTTLKPGSTQQWSIYGFPLLASGTYGQGRTFAFTGFTPAVSAHADGFLDEQMLLSPESEAFAGLIAELISAAANDPLTQSVSALRDEHERPLFQSLKEAPSTTLTATIAADSPASNVRQRYHVEIVNGPNYARLVRLNLDDAQQHNPSLIALIGDSYFDMLPNEHKTVTVDWIQQDKGSGSIQPIFQVEATNAPAISLTIKP